MANLTNIFSNPAQPDGPDPRGGGGGGNRHNGKRAPVYYYRDKDKKEIDLFIVQDGAIYPLEFKKTASPDKTMVRNFALLEQLKMPVKEGGVVCLAETLLPIAKDINAIPVGLL